MSERSERALGSGENSRCLSLIDSEMAEPIKLKLGGMVEGIGENIVPKEFFDSSMLTGVRSVGHRCLF